MKHIAIMAIVLLYIFSNSSCKKSSDSTTPTSDSGYIYVHLHTNLDTNEADYGNVYYASDGRRISISLAQMLISNIDLVKADGSLLNIKGKIILKMVEQEAYLVAKVPVGSYQSVYFHVGVDSATNSMPSTDTALTHPEMMLNNTAQSGNYIFLNFQGTVDTSSVPLGSSAALQPFMFEIGTNAHYTTVHMPNHTPLFKVVKDQDAYIHLTIDYYKLLNGVTLNNSNNLMIMNTADNATATANIIANKIATAFSYED